MALDLKKKLKESMDSAKNAAEKAQSAMKNFNMQDTMNSVKEKGNEAATLIKQKSEETVQAVANKLKKDEPVIEGTLTIEGVLQLMYLLMSADEQITDDELAQFHEIGKEIDQQYEEHKTKLLDDCKNLVADMEQEDYQDEIRDLAKEVVDASMNVPGGTIPVKLLLWDLMVIAMSDNEFQDSEMGLIRYIAKHIGVSKSLIPEMENSIRAMDAIDHEIQWLKTTDNRPYSIVGPQIEEMERRKKAIMEGIHMLIAE